MNPRQRQRRTEDVPGPVHGLVPGAGPGTSTDLPPGKFDDVPGQMAIDEDLVLVSENELALIGWAGYDAAIAEAAEHRDRAIAAAAERLDKATRAAYADYGLAVDGAEKSFAAARRAAMNAHELAHAGQAPQ